MIDTLTRFGGARHRTVSAVKSDRSGIEAWPSSRRPPSRGVENVVVAHSDDLAATAPGSLWERQNSFAPVVARILGSRVGERRREEDGGTLLTVIDLTEADAAAVAEAAARFDLTGWIRLQRADPAHLMAWEALRHDLMAIAREHSQVLSVHPTPNPGYRRPPVQIALTSSREALSVGADLHERYGDFVAIRVGALPYPVIPDADLTASGRGTETPRTPADPAELTLSLDGSLSVRSGDTAHHGVRLSNLGVTRLIVHTNGLITAIVVDPTTGEDVGGYVGPQIAPMVRFVVDPGQEVRIPLLVGTASWTSSLGYSVPPGAWQLVVPLDLADGRHLVSTPMDFIVTD